MKNIFSNIIFLFYLFRWHRTIVRQSFNGILNLVKDIIIIMPRDAEQINQSLPIIQHLDKQKKHLTLIVHNRYRSLLPYPVHLKIEEIFENDINWFGLPKSGLLNRIHRMNAGVVIDFNHDDEFFSTLCSHAINADFKIGVKKKFADRVYNLQFGRRNNSMMESYQNYVNLLFTL